jgi:hypothetical protein
VANPGGGGRIGRPGEEGGSGGGASGSDWDRGGGGGGWGGAREEEKTARFSFLFGLSFPLIWFRVCVCGDGGLELLLATSADGDGSNYLLGYLKGEQ